MKKTNGKGKKRPALRTPRSARRSTAAQEQVREVRKDLKLTQQQLAVELGVTSMTIHRWESGFNPPKMALVAMEYLRHRAVCRSGSMKPAHAAQS